MVQRTATGDVLRRRLDHLAVLHPVVGTLVFAIAWVVVLLELGQDSPDSFPAVIIVTGGGMDDDQIQVGLLVPAAGGPGAKEDGSLNVGIGHQVPAKSQRARVGTQVDYGRQLIADAVSSHRRHGAALDRPKRRKRISGLLTMGTTGSPGG